MRTIFRSVLNSDFTILPNKTLRDSRLSFKARGILAMALSNKDDWEVKPMSLVNENGEGMSAIRTGLAELRKLGYCKMQKLKDKEGHFYCLWIFHDMPQCDCPKEDNPNAGFPNADNRNHKEELSKEKTIKEEETKEKEQSANAESNVSIPKNDNSKLKEHIVNSWNSCEGLKKIIAFSPPRKKALEQRIKEPFFIQNWLEGISRISASDFCKGKNDRGWKADFDFFIRPGTLVKVMEGKYDNRIQPKKNNLEGCAP